MRRWVFNLTALLSLLLCVATGVLWATSFWRALILQAEWVGGEPDAYGELPAHHSDEIGCRRGVLYLVLRRSVGPNALDETTGRLFPVKRGPVKFALNTESADDEAPGPFSRRAWRWDNLRHYLGGETYGYFRFASMPAWVIVVGTLILPACKACGRHGASGCCRSCRYDLTGNTSGVCPECGTAVAGKAEGVA